MLWLCLFIFRRLSRSRVCCYHRGCTDMNLLDVNSNDLYLIWSGLGCFAREARKCVEFLAGLYSCGCWLEGNDFALPCEVTCVRNPNPRPRKLQVSNNLAPATWQPNLSLRLESHPVSCCLVSSGGQFSSSSTIAQFFAPEPGCTSRSFPMSFCSGRGPSELPRPHVLIGEGLAWLDTSYQVFLGSLVQKGTYGFGYGKLGLGLLLLRCQRADPPLK